MPQTNSFRVLVFRTILISLLYRLSRHPWAEFRDSAVIGLERKKWVCPLLLPDPVSTDAEDGLSGVHTVYRPLILPQTCTCDFRSQTHSGKGCKRQRATLFQVFSASNNIKHIRPKGWFAILIKRFQPSFSPSHAIIHTSWESLLKKTGVPILPLTLITSLERDS